MNLLFTMIQVRRRRGSFSTSVFNMYCQWQCLRQKKVIFSWRIDDKIWLEDPSALTNASGFTFLAPVLLNGNVNVEQQVQGRASGQMNSFPGGSERFKIALRGAIFIKSGIFNHHHSRPKLDLIKL